MPSTTTQQGGAPRNPHGSPDDDATVRVGEEDEPLAETPSRHLGRYLVVGQIGAGGMGQVLRAYDPRLHREVALKVLRAMPDESHGAQIVREARAMARLSHPNLVPVYDVEQDGRAVFIAMEYVEGDTLRAWLDRARRPWREIVTAFIGAGRGLAAAHAGGVIHRDFKPTNVMVGADGRARVMDFGIARCNAEMGSAADTLSQPQESSELTRAGTTVGTPPYMSPEQHSGRDIGPASDQYSFCVALYEALYGVRPFRGDDLEALCAAKLVGVPATPVDGAGVPRWLRAAVVRGFVPDASQRWPTIDALLAALERGQARARSQQLGIGLALLGVVVGVAVLVQRLDLRARTRACEAAGASIDEAWNDAARARLRSAFAATGLGYAETAADRVLPWLDEHASAWRSARTEACLDHTVRERWDADTLDRSTWCLDERRLEFEALIGALGNADALAVQRALPAAADLGRVDACRDAAALHRLPPAPTQQREAVRAIGADLSRAAALQGAGQYAAALAVAVLAREQADALGWPPLQARARAHEADLLDAEGLYGEAEIAATDAYFAAANAGAWAVAASAATRMLSIVGVRLQRYDESLAWARHARMALDLAGDAVGDGEARRLGTLGHVHLRRGEIARARPPIEQALAISEAVVGPTHPIIATRLADLATVHLNAGEFATARALLERSLAIKEAALGSDHPDVAAGLLSLAHAAYATGEYAVARTFCERALSIDEAALGAEHPDVAKALNNLALVVQATDHAAARPLHARALAIRERVLGPDHPDVAKSVANLALLDAEGGDHVRARAHHQRVTSIFEKTLGPTHPELAMSLGLVAATYVATGEPDQALPLLERAVAIYALHDGVQNEELATVFSLAKTLVATGGPRARARSLAERARDTWRSAGVADHGELAEIDAWIAALGDD